MELLGCVAVNGQEGVVKFEKNRLENFRSEVDYKAYTAKVQRTLFEFFDVSI